MSQHFYRFRPIHALLDGYHELENQEIYFCPYRQLNDPLEGFKDIFWKGDDIVWRNLLRHYLHCLMVSTTLTAVMGHEFSPTVCETLAHQTTDDLPQAPIRDIYAAICADFFGQEAPQVLVTALASQARALRRDELIFYLRIIHPLALSKVLAVFGERGLALLQSTDALDQIIGGVAKRLSDILHAQAQAVEMPDALFSTSENVQSQLHLIQELSQPVDDARRSRLFVVRDFPNYYVNAIERLLYPDWYTACFVANPTDASMWGGYGDGHQGVCLKFNTKSNVEGCRTLDLYRATAWSGSKEGTSVTHYDYVPHRFEKVRYTGDFPAVDFFESLGTLPRFKRSGFWYADQDGKLSSVFSRILAENEGWRRDYWHKFGVGYITKCPEWKHEGEHRLAVYSSLTAFDTVESRKLKYRFADLAGIAFGIRTPTEDKIRIMRIIERKCAAEDRKDFEFYQAHYSIVSKKIELATLMLLGTGSAVSPSREPG